MECPWEIRRAGPDALAAADPLLQRFFIEEGFTTPPETIRTRLAAMLAREACAVFLAWEAGVAIGVATVSTSFGIEYGHSAEMDDLYVLPEARGRGVAGALIAAVRAWCQAQGCMLLLVTVTPEGQEVHGLTAFYLRRGFSDDGRKLLAFDLARE